MAKKQKSRCLVPDDIVLKDGNRIVVAELTNAVFENAADAKVIQQRLKRYVKSHAIVKTPKAIHSAVETCLSITII